MVGGPPKPGAPTTVLGLQQSSPIPHCSLELHGRPGEEVVSGHAKGTLAGGDAVEVNPGLSGPPLIGL